MNEEQCRERALMLYDFLTYSLAFFLRAHNDTTDGCVVAGIGMLVAEWYNVAAENKGPDAMETYMRELKEAIALGNPRTIEKAN